MARAQLLMCPPTYFGVEYEINPWMQGNVGSVNQARAQQQWDALHTLLQQRADVQLVAPLQGYPDMCFVANAGLVLDQTFVPARFRVAQRAGEVPGYQSWFHANRFQIEAISDPIEFEGEGDALFHPNTLTNNNEPILWAGYGVRSNLLAHPELTNIFRVCVYSLRLVDERFYHLDTCFTPLPDGRAFYFAEAFDARSLQLLRDKIPAEKRIEVSTEDALGFCCNAVRIDNTLIMNHASPSLRRQLCEWGYETLITPLDEFLLAGGSAKCLTLILGQETLNDIEARPTPDSPICSTQLEMAGHLLDSGSMNKVLDIVMDNGGSFQIDRFSAGLRHDQSSAVQLRVAAPDRASLDTLVTQCQPLGAKLLHNEESVRLEVAPADGVAPDDFYSTTIYPTEVCVCEQWLPVQAQRMDVVIVVDQQQARCCLIRDLRAGDRVICGSQGIRVHAPKITSSEKEFDFMSAGVSSERRVERVVEELAWEMQRIRARNGRIVVVAGPVVVHTGGGPHLCELIEGGYVQALLTGNALPTHDIEFNMFGTSLGIDLNRGTGVPHGHQHHLRAINRVRKAGSIKKAVEQNLITGGIMFACVKHKVETVLAGSIRDDGPLPDTLMDLEKAQAAYAKALEKADMVLMLSSMLHAIGTGNMTPAGVKLICVDINPAVVTKLADRGSIESVGIVTDVGLFLNLLSQQLLKTQDMDKTAG